MTEINRWSGKDPEDVLTESFHEIRNPILQMAGFLNILRSLPNLSDEEAKYFLDQAIANSQAAKEVVGSVFDYINEKWGKQ
ncbi:MAG: hypothetical protein IT314_00370 [Anaerolineales bacterium]|nr:hypothetical protein [Anaerolineales bacterium]